MLNLQAIQIELCRERQELLLRTQPRLEISKGDEADIAVTYQNKARALWLANDAKNKIRAIEDALRRIELGSYGNCLRCGAEIPEERLCAMPATLYCVSCQNHLERLHI